MTTEGQIDLAGNVQGKLLRGGQLQKAIVATARALGWRVAHFPPVQTERGWRVPVGADGKGWPDLVLVRERVLVLEVKGAGDYLKPEQEMWLGAFRLAGVTALVATPVMWAEGAIEAELRRRQPTTSQEVPVVG